MFESLAAASRLLPGKQGASWQEEALPGFPASLHSRKQEAGSNLPEAGPQKAPTRKFKAGTCPQCHHITIAGLTDFGFTLHLEPTTLTDLDEYNAIRDGVPTYNFWPDRTVRRRTVSEIRAHEVVPRHARHTCGTTYGTHTSAPARTRAALSDTPPF